MAQEGELRVIDRWAGGVGWIAHPEESLERASHVLAVDGSAWVVDPVDHRGLDDLLGGVGRIEGVVVALDRHVRDAEAVADRHGVPVHLHETLAGVAGRLSVPTETFGEHLPGTGYRTIPLVTNRFWREVALFNPEIGTLLVPEAVGTAAFFRTGNERLGVHPALRLFPPRRALSDLPVDRVLVGHGPGVVTDAAAALKTALAGARRRAPRLYVEAVARLLR